VDHVAPLEPAFAQELAGLQTGDSAFAGVNATELPSSLIRRSSVGGSSPKGVDMAHAKAIALTITVGDDQN
jgi:hypothetical protein